MAGRSTASREEEACAAYCDFLEVAVHQILFLRHLYPPESFEPCMFAGVPVQRNRHPAVCEYVSSAVSDLKPLLLKGAVQRVDVAILPASTQTPLVLTGTTDPHSTSSSRGSPSGSAPQGSPGLTGATTEERFVFQCSTVAAAAESGGRPLGTGLGRAGASEARDGEERERERGVPGEVEQALRTALLRLSTTQHSVNPGATWELIAHSSQLSSVEGPPEVQAWIARGALGASQSTPLESSMSPICSVSGSFLSFQVLRQVVKSSPR